MPYLGEPETIIPLEISKEGQFAEIFLGIDGEASEGSDGFDRLLPPLPPGETRPVSLTGLENYAKIDFERSVKPEVNSIQWEILTNTDVEIAWNPGNLPADYSFNIQSEGRTYSMNETIALAVPASQRILITAEKIVPSKATLLGNYPNPFNAQTTISFSLPARTEVDLSVFNLLGETVSGLFSGELEAGKHQTTWEGTNDQGASLPSGVYYYKLRVGEEEQVRKMLLVK